jgi:hypothetical protein
VINHITEGKVMIRNAQNAIKALTGLGLSLLALGIVVGLLSGGSMPFVGNIAGNIVSLVNQLGNAGVVGLIAVGVILWLFRD